MPKQTKANKATVEARVNKVYDYLIMGMNRARMWQAATNEKSKDRDLFAGITQRQIDRYIAKANEKIKQVAAFHREQELGKAIERYNYAIEQTARIQDWPRFITANDKLASMLGLSEPVVTELRITGDEESALLKLQAIAQKKNVKLEDVLTKILERWDDDNE
jgi:hypothetical protein